MNRSTPASFVQCLIAALALDFLIHLVIFKCSTLPLTSPTLTAITREMRNRQSLMRLIVVESLSPASVLRVIAPTTSVSRLFWVPLDRVTDLTNRRRRFAGFVKVCQLCGKHRIIQSVIVVAIRINTESVISLFQPIVEEFEVFRYTQSVFSETPAMINCLVNSGISIALAIHSRDLIASEFSCLTANSFMIYHLISTYFRSYPKCLSHRSHTDSLP